MTDRNSDPAGTGPAPQFAPSRRTRRLAYPSDLTDTQWKRLEPLLPAEKPRGRQRFTSLREVVNGINYRWSTGCVWRMLPHDFPPWTTVYTYYRQWLNDGTLLQIHDSLLGRGRQRAAEPPARSGEPARVLHQASA
ncbi:MAG: transposase [Planctomycetaceae bacterium]|nr:transposase [Planctomycetaceae bacterium]